MAVYEYTLRAESKIVEDIEIARYAYAYKHSWDLFPGCSKRKVRAMERFADDAVYAHSAVTHYVMADHFAECEKEPMPIFQRETLRSSISSTANADTVVGYLIKVGRRYAIRSVAVQAAVIRLEEDRREASRKAA